MIKVSPIASRLIGALLMLAPMAPAVAQTTEGQCLSVTAIQEALQSGTALRLADIRRRIDGDIVKADLCRNQGKLAYVITVLTSTGMVKRVTVDASSGEIMYGGH